MNIRNISTKSENRATECKEALKFRDSACGVESTHVVRPPAKTEVELLPRASLVRRCTLAFDGCAWV